MTFHTGQKVTMTSDKGEWTDLTTLEPVGDAPIFGVVYTVVSITNEWAGCFLGLVELTDEFVFNSISFRPVCDRKTDISVFNALLTPAPHKLVEA